MKHTDTRALVARARAGDRAAFDEVIARHRSRLAALIEQRLGERLRPAISAEDVLQEALVRAFRSIDRFEWRDDDAARTNSFFRWLAGIAVRVILEEARRNRKQAPIALEFDLASPDDASPSRTLARKERLARFEAALERLSPDQRTVLRLVRLEGRPLAEVAALTGRSTNAVSQLVLRALRRLRRDLASMDGSDSLRLAADEPGPGGGEEGGGHARE
jgi:RNA polymerase sigma-70 factor (ECF subfamily)